VHNDKPDVSTLDRSVITNIRRVADASPVGEAASATLYHAAGKALH